MGRFFARPLVKDTTFAQSFIARSSNGLQIRKGNLNRHKDGRNEFFQGSKEKNFRGVKSKIHFFRHQSVFYKYAAINFRF